MGINASAIIVAAGSGQRMGFDKVFYKLLGKEVILYSLEAMEKNPKIDEIILVVAKSNLEKAEKLCSGKFPKLRRIVEGGSSRTESVLNGINASCGKYIAIHDGARPLISQKIITDCIESVEKYDAVTVSLPVTDTIKSFKDGFTDKSLNRDEMVSVQTPQCFNKEMYLSCVEKLGGRSFTDDCALFEECGIPVKLITGEERNLKLTRRADIIIAKALLEGEEI